MKNIITYTGVIHFDPVDLTKKHKNQAEWKRMALVLLDGDICEYYAWFLKKRFNLVLNKPIRGGHISFINDSLMDMIKGLKCSQQEAEVIWNSVKTKYDNQDIKIVLDLDVRTDANHWWLNILEEYRTELHSIREEIGLNPRPFFGLHMSLGYVNNKYIEHSKYILNCIQKGLIIN